MTPKLRPKKDRSYDQVARARIVRWRMARGMTQAQLGERIGRKPTWISRYENQQLNADLATIARMAQVFDQTLFAALDVPQDVMERDVMERFRLIHTDQRQFVLQLLDLFAERQPSKQGGVGKRRRALLASTVVT